MPESVITEYLEKHTYAGFNEIASVFRHDFVLYAGMLSSWTALIDAELMMAEESAFETAQSAAQFRQASTELQAKTEDVFTRTTARLYPQVTPVPDQEPFEHVKQTWADYYADFSAFALPELSALEKQVHAFIAFPDFEAVIEQKLGALSEDDSIASLLLRPFERLRNLLTPANFDARVAEAVNPQKAE